MNVYIATEMQDCFFQNAQLVGFEIKDGSDMDRSHPSPTMLPPGAQLTLQKGDILAISHRNYGMDGREWRVYTFLE